MAQNDIHRNCSTPLKKMVDFDENTMRTERLPSNSVHVSMDPMLSPGREHVHTEPSLQASNDASILADDMPLHLTLETSNPSVEAAADRNDHMINSVSQASFPQKIEDGAVSTSLSPQTPASHITSAYHPEEHDLKDFEGLRDAQHNVSFGT